MKNDRKRIASTLKRMGYEVILNEGIPTFKHQMKTFWVVPNNGTKGFATLMLLISQDIKPTDVCLALTACNSINRKLPAYMLFMDDDLQNVIGAFSFFYTGRKSLKSNLRHGLEMMGGARYRFYQAMIELNE